MTDVKITDETRAKIREAIEAALLCRIKFIGDNDQLYTGYPAQLIAELTAVIERIVAEAVAAEREQTLTGQVFHAVEHRADVAEAHAKEMSAEAARLRLDLSIEATRKAELEAEVARLRAFAESTPHLENDVARGYVFRVEPARLREPHDEEGCKQLNGRCAAPEGK